MGKYYETDPNDPEAPVELTEYGDLRVGSKVRYQNLSWFKPDGTYATAGMDDVYTVYALYRFPEMVGEGDYVEAILDDGEWQVNADNLVLVKEES
jgi:hypothetical protein